MMLLCVALTRREDHKMKRCKKIGINISNEKGDTLAEILVALTVIIIAVSILSAGVLCCTKMIASSKAERVSAEGESDVIEDVTVEVKLTEYTPSNGATANIYDFSLAAELHISDDMRFYTVIK